MCLYIKEKLPRVAERDIVCLKILSKEPHGFYRTPYRGVIVQLNSKIEASSKTVDISFAGCDHLDNNVYSVNGGVIHSVLLDKNKCKNNSWGCVKKAIIPKGTEYYIGRFGLEIASKELYITDKDGSIKDLDMQFLEELLEEAPEKNGVRVGDYLMNDGNFVHPKEKLHKNKIIGIVVGFYKESPLIAALDRFEHVSFGENISSIIDETFIDGKSAIQDFNGKKHTKKYTEYAYNRGCLYKAFSKCVRYKKSGIKNWYLPSLGEVSQMLDNSMYINIAYLISGLGYLIDANNYYWTSSESNRGYSWCCDQYFGKIECGWLSVISKGNVVPFLDYKAYNDEHDKKLTGLFNKINRLFS